MTAQTTNRPMPSNILDSLHKAVDRYNGSFASMRQRKFLVARLAEYSKATVMAEDEQSRRYVIEDCTGTLWGFTCYRRYGRCLERTLIHDAIVELTEGEKEQMRAVLQWGPSEVDWVIPAPVAELIAERANLDADECAMVRASEDGRWGADDLNWITRIQIAAKGLLAEIGDNAGQSPVAMSAADAAYVSQMITEGHIRNAHWFQRKTMSEKALRRATIVNKAKLDEATAALAQRMVDLMNAAAARLGRPVTFAEYTAQMAA